MKKKQEKSKYSAGAGNIGQSIDLAVEYLQQGRIVAFPTETYYGLAVDPENGSAVERLYDLKQRPESKPLLLLVDSTEKLQPLVKSFPGEYKSLVERFWPGPLTLIFPAADRIHPTVTAGTGTVGIRISPHPVAAELVKKFGSAITATSANLSGQQPATKGAEVKEMFGDAVDYILDGGTTSAGLCSTIVTLEAGQLQVIRQGEVDPFSCETDIISP